MREPLTQEMILYCLRLSEEHPGASGISWLAAGYAGRESMDGLTAAEEVKDRVLKESVSRLRLCYFALPQKERTAIRETYLVGDKVAAAAQRLHVSRNTLSKYRKRGMLHLSELYHSKESKSRLRERCLRSALGSSESGEKYGRLQNAADAADGTDPGGTFGSSQSLQCLRIDI